MLPFQERLTLHQRAAEFERVSSRKPHYVPTIVNAGSRDAPRLPKEKYLLPCELTGAQLAFVLRRHLKLDPSAALFLLCGGRLVPAQTQMRELRDKERSEDGFLYLVYSLENAFG